MQIYWIKTHAPRRVLALARHLGLAFDAIHVDLPAGGLKSPAYVALNPNMKAPVLVDGDHTLWESSAIMAYMCVKAGSDLWPARDPMAQVDVMRWIAWNDCHWFRPLGMFYFEHVIKPQFKFGTPNPEALQTFLPDVERYTRVLDDHLSRHAFVAADRLTIADFHLASIACQWREACLPLQPYAHVLRWLDRMQQVPGWADPWPDTVAHAA